MSDLLKATAKSLIKPKTTTKKLSDLLKATATSKGLSNSKTTTKKLSDIS